MGNQIDELQDELVLLDTNNRAFRASVRERAIQTNWTGKRLCCVLCDHSWEIGHPEAHDSKCPLSPATPDTEHNEVKEQ